MTECRDMSWLSEFRDISTRAVGLLVEICADDDVPSEYGNNLPEPRRIRMSPERGQSGNWSERLAREMQDCGSGLCLANLLCIPSRSVSLNMDGMTFKGAAAAIAGILKHAPPGSEVAVLASMSLTTDSSYAEWRSWVGSNHCVETIIYLGASAAALFGAHLQFRSVVLLIRCGRPAEDEAVVTRLIDLRESPRTDWRRVAASARKRNGGEGELCIALRDAILASEPWIYERYSKQFQVSRKDAATIGTLRPLGDIVHDFCLGIHRTLEAALFRDLDDTEGVADGHIPCFGGRCIQKSGVLHAPVWQVLQERVPTQLHLRAGDILVRRIVKSSRTEAPVLAAGVTGSDLPATFDDTCIRIRFLDDDVDVPKLVADYLNSVHARDWLIAHGVGLSIPIGTMQQLEVPIPSEELRQALKTLAEAELQYRGWADEVAETRQTLFSSSSIAVRVSAVLERQRVELDRVKAARDADSLDYRIRNYFPHPIALRWEHALQADPGRPRLEAIMECAEHLVAFLGTVALLQSDPGKAQGSWAAVKSFQRDGALHMDWGKSVTLLSAGVQFAAAQPNPLALRFPELMELADSMNPTSDFGSAERYLRNQRNSLAHLQRVPDADMEDLSENCLAKLNQLMRSVSFMGALRLVYVRDYRICPVTSKRSARFDLLQGISPVFRQEEMEVACELPRSAVGFLTSQGVFISALPWLAHEHCQVCKRPEIFIFNRLNNRSATFIAMESGHAQENSVLGAKMHELIQGL